MSNQPHESDSFGQNIVKNLEEFIRDVKAGKPMRQSIVRRMKVKGKTVYVHDSFTAPVKGFSQ